MKKTITKVLVFSVLFLLCVSPCVLASEEIAPQKCGQNVYYTINEVEKTLTISGEGKMYDYKDGLESPFYSLQDVSEVIVKDGVTSIGDFAFYCMCISKITVPDSLVSIGKNSLTMTYIKKLDIPKNVVKIDRSNYFNFNLTTINVALDNAKFASENGVLFNKDKTKIIAYPMNKKGPYVVPRGIKTIGNGSFRETLKLKSISFPNSVEVIEKDAFDGANLQEITKYSKNIKQIGGNAFRATRLKKFKIGQNVKKFSINAFADCEKLKDFVVNKKNKTFCAKKGVVFSKDEKTLVVFPNGRNGSYILPENTKKVSKYAFYGAYEMTEIVLNSKLIHIGKNAFTATQIKEIIIPEGVKVIGKNAFAYCEALKKIKFKGRIPSLRTGAFNKFYDEEVMTGNPNPKFYVNNKSLAKKLKIKLKNSGLKSAKIYYDNSGKYINLKH